MRVRTETVIAAYRPKPGKAHELRKLIDEHRRTLDEAQLASPKPTILLRARSDGTLLEIFEWASAKAADEAHQHPSIRGMWNKLAKVADFISLSEIEEANNAFSHFEGVSQRPARETARTGARQPKR